MKKTLSMNHRCRDKWIAIGALGLYLFSLLPILILAYYDYPTGDSLVYAAPVHDALLEGKVFLEILAIIHKDVVQEFNTFNGTWFACYLWRIDPAIWEGHWYGLTAWISTGSLSVGLFLLCKEWLQHWMGVEKYASYAIYAMTAFTMIQYIPTAMSGIYFYPGVIKYILAFGLVMAGIATLLGSLRTGSTSQLAVAMILMLFVGGAGYPEVMVAGLALTYIILLQFGHHRSVRQVVYSLMVTATLCVGFAISALAPGTRARGGENVGVSAEKVIYTLSRCINIAGTEFGRYFIKTPIMPILIITVIVLIWRRVDVTKRGYKLRWVLPNALMGFFVFAGAYAPEVFVGPNVRAGISGGVYCSYYLTWLVVVMGNVIYFTGLVKTLVLQRKRRNADLRIRQCVLFAICCGTILYAIFWRGPILRETVDYACIRFATSGRLADYEAQFKERFAILEVDGIRDVILPEMNDDQYPFMHMAIVEDSNNFTNQAVKRFYGKNTVIAMPRVEFYQRYGSDLSKIIEQQLAEQDITHE